MTAGRPSARRVARSSLPRLGAAAHVGRVQLRLLLRLAVGGQLLGRAEAGVGPVLGQQSVDGGRVERPALRLTIRPVGSARRLAGHLRSLVPLEAQPVQAVEDVALVGERGAGLRRCPPAAG